jgi:hypothetical protein
VDVILLQREEVPPDEELGFGVSFVAATFINGVDLRELVVATQREELTARFQNEESLREWYESLDKWLDPANQIAFLALEDVGRPSRHWLGAPDPALTERGRAAVLTCTCGCYGCGGAAAYVTIDDETVIWSDFREANSDTVIPIGPFRFDRRAYEAAIAAL